MRKVAIYVHVSTTNQALEGYSIDEQIEKEIARLITEWDELLAGNLELETAVNDLRVYTDMFVGGE